MAEGTGSKVRIKMILTPTEECDEGFEHIDSDMLKRLGGSLKYELQSTNEGDKIYYDASISVTTSTADLIANGESYLTSGDVDGTNDRVKLLYIRNTDGTNFISIATDGDALASAATQIIVRPGEVVFLRINEQAPINIHAKADTATCVCEVFAIINDAA